MNNYVWVIYNQHAFLDLLNEKLFVGVFVVQGRVQVRRFQYSKYTRRTNDLVVRNLLSTSYVFKKRTSSEQWIISAIIVFLSVCKLINQS